MPTLKITKERKQSNSVKPTNIYLDTHEKLTALSAESGISIVKLIAIMVDFSMENMVLVDPESED